VICGLTTGIEIPPDKSDIAPPLRCQPVGRGAECLATPVIQGRNVPEVALDSLVCAADMGDILARDRLFTELYAQLHRMAQRELHRNAAVTLSPTTLLHEAFLNLSQRDTAFPDRGRFIAYAARAMRGLLIDYLRSRQAQKRGGEFYITTLATDPGVAVPEQTSDEGLSAALDELARVDPRLAECVDLKFYCGFSFADIAQMRGVSERTVQRDWDKARILLHRFLSAQADADPAP
jgi:RNA polymerase sigma factor (TIGR02999 family)